MKLLFVVCALIGLAAAAQLPDSATQGPNPQDIATPEPEYIDIDLPEPAPVAVAASAPAPQPIRFAPAPRPIQRPVFVAAPTRVQPQVFHPQPQVFHPQPQVFHPQPQLQARPSQPHPQQLVPGHAYSKQSGYQYRRPVYVRRVYRRRY